MLDWSIMDMWTWLINVPFLGLVALVLGSLCVVCLASGGLSIIRRMINRVEM